MANSRCCTSQLYEPILARETDQKPMAQAADLRIQTVGVAGFEPTASSSRMRVGRDDQYQRVLWRARGSPRRVAWCHCVAVGC
jgi:hypothetical protein